MKVKSYSVVFLLGSLTVISGITTTKNSQSSWSFKGSSVLAATRTDSNQIGFFNNGSNLQAISHLYNVNVMSVGIDFIF